MVSDVVEDGLRGAPKGGKRAVIAIACNLPLQLFPEVLNQIQVRRIGREIEQFDPQRAGRLHDRRRLVVGRVVQDHHEPPPRIGSPNLVEQLRDPLGSTRLPAFQGDQALVVGGIGSKHIEASPTGIGAQRHGLSVFDPPLTRHRCVQEVGRIEEVHATAPGQGPLFSA